jgi:hypothetical protein
MMRKGSFALFDALGTRGIWRRHKPEEVVAKFEELRASFEAFREGQLGGPGAPALRSEGSVLEDVVVAFLSDTVVVAVIPTEKALAESPLAMAQHAVIVAARFAGVAIEMAANLPPGWAYRGAISFGELMMRTDGSFFIGQAVDEAAELFEVADGAFIMLTPAAAELFKDGYPPVVGNIPPVTPWEVPLRDGRSVDALVVSPFDVTTSPERAEELRGHILSTFTTSTLDVTIKRQNTERWLNDHLAEWNRRYREEHAQVEKLTRGQGR